AAPRACAGGCRAAAPLLWRSRRGCARRGGCFLLCLGDGCLRDFLCQLTLHLVEGRSRRGRVGLVRLRERLGLCCLRLRLRCRALLLSVLALQLRLGALEREL